VYAAAAHAAFTPDALALFGADSPDEVWVSDSVNLTAAYAAPVDARRLRICSIAPLFAQAIRALAAR
jgi:phosphoribosylpyrophosphate synthetase